MTAIRPAIRSAIQPAIRSAFGAAIWDPLTLFAASEQGVWYDPSDLTTMFQDSAGTTPVTADGQTVGLILDKSKGLVLGSELVTNGDFSNGTTGWTGSATPTVVNGALNVTSTWATASTTVTWTAGVFYKLTFSAGVTGSRMLVRNGALDMGDILPGQNITIIYRAPSTGTATINFINNNGGSATVSLDNVSIKAIAGNHAYQATASSRPLYKTSGGLHWLQFDGVDDYLFTSAINFSATDEIVYACAARIEQLAKIERIISTANVSAPAANLTVSTVPRLEFSYGGTTLRAAATAGLSVPVVNVLVAQGKVSTDYCSLAIDGGAELTNALDQGTGNIGTTAIYLGARSGGNYLTGRIYGAVVRAALLTAPQAIEVKSYLAGKSGVVL